MKRIITLAAGLTVGAGIALADEVAPSAVEYDEYGAVAASLTGVPGNAEHGREVMIDRGLGNCIACHAVTALEDQPFHGEVGPSLDGAADRWTEADLRGLVANAKMTFDGTVMPSFYKVDGFIRPGDDYTGRAATEIKPILSAQDIEDVVAYLMTLAE